jgi:hypothetical protein
MDLTTYVAGLRADLVAAAELGGDEARALADRLTGPMEPAFRLAMIDVLSAAAGEIARDLAPGSIELRVRGREPSFVVTPPPADPESAAVLDAWTPPPPLDSPGFTPGRAPVPEPPDTGSMTRINLRLNDQLKTRIEDAARRDRLSVNAWLVRAADAALQPQGAPSSAPPSPPRSQSFTQAQP